MAGWLTGLHSKSCMPFWLQCEVFHVLSAPTICFYKAVPPLSIFPLYVCLFIPPRLLLSASFPPHFSLCHILTFHFFSLTFSLFLFLSIFHSPCSYHCLYSDLLFHLFSVVSCRQHAPHPPLHPHFLLFLFTVPPSLFSFQPPDLLISSLFLSLFHLPFLAMPLLKMPHATPKHDAFFPAVNTCTNIQHTAFALLPAHRDKCVWGKLITNLKEALK